ncbi:hypothetical protein [Glycomyces sp. YM15]|uniref:hypothetical protein n=1 Tax=Glycomyces sp. YM15 TaxID=2800446 RepID=UPI001965F760|nr:hypothetical protein [Glycomyces sp. YM15]
MSTVDLMKFPLLVVTGTTVTPEQSDEIIIRTARLDAIRDGGLDWQVGVHDAFDVVSSLSEAAARTGNLGVRWTSNLRITASRSGSYGWCDWNGRIFCSNYFLGPWPDLDEVDAEWRCIADAFPFLDMEMWLVGDEGRGAAAGHWTLRSGAVTELPLTAVPPAVADREYEEVAPGYQDGRGVTVERLQGAVARAVASQAGATP